MEIIFLISGVLLGVGVEKLVRKLRYRNKIVLIIDPFTQDDDEVIEVED